MATPRTMPYRLAPRQYQSRGGCMARISEDARRCSVFLGWDASIADDPAAIRLEGTGFLVYVGEGGVKGVYLVTAAHIARKLGSDPFVIRMNDVEGNARLDHVDGATWYFHPSDPSVDVAVMRYEPPEWTDSPTLPASEFIDPVRARYWKIGPGDAVYLIGLFYLHAGKKRNLAVVHTGHIGLMPSDERIPVEKDDGSGDLEEVEAYLVEAQALKGASGSPVMVRPTIKHMVTEHDDQQESLAISEGRDFLLGVWTAAWPGRPDKILGEARGVSQSTWVPVGMGLVVPCIRILDIIRRTDLIEERRKAMKEITRSHAASPTGLSERPAKSEPPTTEGGEQHKERFTSLLNAAARKRPPAD